MIVERFMCIAFVSTVSLLLYIARKLYTMFRKYFIKKEAEARDYKVCIVGAGFGGIGAGLTLDDMGLNCYTIIEKSADVGGTWYDNIYPGIGCDVQSHLYSYSYFPNPSWSESFSEGPEILEYIKKLAIPLRHKIQFNTAVISSTWKEEISKWEVALSSGVTITVDVVITATGLLHKPSTPTFTGDKLYEGIKFHTNKWNENVNFLGKNVGVIGTGASAVQVVPRVARLGVDSLTVFQRTPAWVVPRFNYRYWGFCKEIFRYFPFIRTLYRWFLFWNYEVRFFILLMLPNKNLPLIGKLHALLQSAIHSLVRKHTQKTVLDQSIADKLTPTFPMGRNRITPSDSYLEAFNRENVHLVTDKIREMDSTGITTEDGKKHILDIIIYATGFDLLGSVNAFTVRGIGGQLLSEDHSDAPRAYYGCTHHLCPNFFTIWGPGLVLGHNSALFTGECQLNYIRSGIENMLLKKAKAVTLKEKSMDAYQAWSRNKMKGKVFGEAGFCKGWYRNARGINWTFWPTNVISFWWFTMSFDCQNYVYSQ